MDIRIHDKYIKWVTDLHIYSSFDDTSEDPDNYEDKVKHAPLFAKITSFEKEHPVTLEPYGPKITQVIVIFEYLRRCQIKDYGYELATLYKQRKEEGKDFSLILMDFNKFIDDKRIDDDRSFLTLDEVLSSQEIRKLKERYNFTKKTKVYKALEIIRGSKSIEELKTGINLFDIEVENESKRN